MLKANSFHQVFTENYGLQRRSCANGHEGDKNLPSWCTYEQNFHTNYFVLWFTLIYLGFDSEFDCFYYLRIKLDIKKAVLWSIKVLMKDSLLSGQTC